METKRSSHRWRWIILVLLAAAGLGLGGWFLRNHRENTSQYQTAAVTRGDLVQLVTATGQLNPVLNVQVGSQISGTIQKLFADFNDTVKAGQIVAQIDPATYQANVSQAEGDLASAGAALELAQFNANRAKELFDSKLLPRSDYDKALADLHQAEAVVKIKDATLSKVRVDLARCTIYSPIDGIVISRSVDVGQTVAASLSAPTLFIIANDLSKMQIDANVAEADVGAVEVGQKVEFTVDAFPMRPFTGKVVQIRNSPITVQNVVSYDTVVEVSNPDLKLKPGMTANIAIIIARRENALRVPNAALRFRPPDAPAPARDGGKGKGGGKRDHFTRTVYVLDAGQKLQPVTIKVGITDGAFTELLEGLKESDKVVTSVLRTDDKADTAAPNNPFSGGGMRPRRF